MSGNDIFELDSMAETEEMEADTELGMIDEEVGEITDLCFARDLFVGSGTLSGLSGILK